MIAVPITVSDPAQASAALEAAQAAAQAGADLVEWRLDDLPSCGEAGLMAAKAVLDASPLPAILTIRSEHEGGVFEGDDDELAHWLCALGETGAGAIYLDIEFARWTRSEPLRFAGAAWRERDTSLILSSHDFNGRPSDLLQRVDAMQAADCDVVKIVWRARSLRDGLECRDLLSAQRRPMIALCMGPAGVMSRVLTGAWGGLITFAAAASDAASAPGQPTIEEMVQRYRFKSLTKHTSLFGLIGDPLGDSPGYELHNRAFEQASFDAVYLPLPVASGWESLKATLSELIDRPEIPFSGASITLPHKLDLIRFAAQRSGEISEMAQQSGAANTLMCDGFGGLKIDNTDAAGIVLPLLACGLKAESSTVAILGSGGVARAAAAALLHAGARVRIFNRTAARRDALIESLHSLGDISAGSIDEGPFDAVVQCTSVGMAHGAHPEESPLVSLDLQAGELVGAGTVGLETIYDPVETRFVEEIRSQGAAVATGYDMWLAQGKAQQRLWTGRNPEASVWKMDHGG